MTQTPRRRSPSREKAAVARPPRWQWLIALSFVFTFAALAVRFCAGASPVSVVRDGAPSWSPDSRRVIYYSEVDGKADLFTVGITGGNRTRITATPQIDEGAPAYSPDGRHIALDSDRHGNFEIFVMNADGTGLRRLTDHPARDVAPAWSPDGRHIVFMSARDNAEFDIYRMDTNGERLERLTTGSSNWFPQVSPDGTRIALHVMRDVHLLDLASRQLTRLTMDPQNGMYPSWAPDGARLAFMSWRNGRTEIFSAKADGSEQTLLLSMPSGDAIDPRWSPDGKSIAFVHVPTGGLGNHQDGTEERLVYVFDIETKKLTRLSR